MLISRSIESTVGVGRAVMVVRITPLYLRAIKHITEFISDSSLIIFAPAKYSTQYKIYTPLDIYIVTNAMYVPEVYSIKHTFYINLFAEYFYKCVASPTAPLKRYYIATLNAESIYPTIHIASIDEYAEHLKVWSPATTSSFIKQLVDMLLREETAGGFTAPHADSMFVDIRPNYSCSMLRTFISALPNVVFDKMHISTVVEFVSYLDSRLDTEKSIFFLTNLIYDDMQSKYIPTPRNGYTIVGGKSDIEIYNGIRYDIADANKRYKRHFAFSYIHNYTQSHTSYDILIVRIDDAVDLNSVDLCEIADQSMKRYYRRLFPLTGSIIWGMYPPQNKR